MRIHWRSTVLVCLFVCFMAGTASADVPSTISFQGRMKDSTGTPYSGSRLVKFAIYDSVGTEIWNSGFNSTTFADGLVTVQLGASPHPALPIGNWLTDTALTLGITVDTDPEITPRIPFTSTGYAFHAGVADELAGFDPSVFVQETGDTMSGPLAVMGSLSVGTDTSISPLTVQSQDNWNWTAGDGWGDVRVGDSSVGFNIGVALGGGGRGATRLWSKGGLAEDIYIGSPTSGEQIMIKGTPDEVNLMSDVGIGTENVRAPLTLQSQNNWRWDIGSGNGDFRIGDSVAGFNIGIALGGLGYGSTRFWTDSGLVNFMTFGSSVAGDVLRIDADSNNVRTYGDLGVGTGLTAPSAPLQVISQNQSRWDLGTGLGDFRLDDGSGGLSVGVQPNGDVNFWASGGTFNNLRFGSPDAGDMMLFQGLTGWTTFYDQTIWRDSSFGMALWARPDANQFSVLGGSNNSNKVDLLGSLEYGRIWLRDSNVVITTSMSARGFPGGGTLDLSRRDGTAGAKLSAGADGGGSQLLLYDDGGSPDIQLLPGAFEDGAVVLPDDAISNSEILDEPGIAFNRRTTGIINLPKLGTSQDFVSVNITTPADGYIVLDGVGYFDCLGDSSAFGWIQISEISNRVQEGGQFHWVGPTGFGTPGITSYTYHSIPIKRFYFKPKGTYTFHLQGNAYNNNHATSVVTLRAPTWLQATYYPVAYGTANAIAESPGDMESATLVSIEDPQTGETAKAYRVDLRELELRSKTARLKALEAQQEALKADLELQRARMKESDSPIVHAGQTDSEVQQ